MLPSETMIWQPEFTDKTLSRKPGAVHRRYLTSTTNNRHVATKPKLNSTSSVPIFLIHLFSAECVCYLQRTQCILRTKNHVNR
ncbi:hypothetical protein FOV70_21455 [Escherichia coli]|nr:hypothetical protein FOV70_21455 [Escherichia coli]